MIERMNKRNSIPRHWLLWGLLLLLSLWWPYALAARLAPPDSEFLGALVNTEDLSVYLAAIRQGSEGVWLFETTFTPERLAPRLSHLLYMALGRLQPFLALDGLQLFHLARLGAAVFLTGFLALWLSRQRMGAAGETAFFLIMLTGGLGWIFLPWSIILPDIHVAEWTPFMSMFYAPHFSLGIAAELGIMAGLLSAAQRPEARRMGPALAAGLSALALTVLYPYKILPTAAIVLAFVAGETILRRRLSFSLILAGLTSWAALGAVGLYYFIVSRSDPYWEITNVVQNVIPAPGVMATLLGWGLPLLLAVAGLRRVLRHWPAMPVLVRLCTVWAVMGFLSLFAPVPFNGRFALGVYLPISILAAWSLHQVILPALARRPAWLGRLSPTPLATARRLLLILAMPSVFVFQGMVVQRTRFFPEFYYLPQAEIQAAHWLAANSDENDLVLSGNRLGNSLPRYIPGRVFLGQYYLTVDSEGKAGLASRFYDPATAEAWRLAFLAEWGITVIYYGSYEAQVGPPPDLPGWRPVYDHDDVVIYRAD
jgi:hypothetical protein